MVEFETVVSRDVKFGSKNFIEVSKKKAITEEGANEFFSLSRGFYTPEGEKRYKKNFSIPADGKTLEAVIAAFKEVEGDSPSQADSSAEAEIEVEDE
ncbi:MAG: hypothetical protein HY366_02475 [Candidatus Aenigmarchaeota archaeon]|nr:hypothetical protein [Candidatus Aenigmarchaeota archaeon]